jgi:hypothetical protein
MAGNNARRHRRSIVACEKEKFLEWVQDYSPSKFVRSEDYQELVASVPEEALNGFVHPFLLQVEELGGAPELDDAIVVFPVMGADEWASGSVGEFFEVLQCALGTGEPRLVGALQGLCSFIHHDLTETGYTTSIARNYGILLEEFCLYEQYMAHPFISENDYNESDYDLYDSCYRYLHTLVRLIEPARMRGVLKEAHQLGVGVAGYCHAKGIEGVPLPWVGDGRRAHLYKTYAEIMRDLASNIMSGKTPDLRFDRISNQHSGIHVESLQEVPETELYQQGGVFDETPLFRAPQPNLDIASCWLLLRRIGVELYGFAGARGFFTLHSAEVKRILKERDTEGVYTLYAQLMDPYQRAKRMSDKPGAVMFRALSQIGDIGVY